MQARATFDWIKCRTILRLMDSEKIFLDQNQQKFVFSRDQFDFFVQYIEQGRPFVYLELHFLAILTLKQFVPLIKFVV